MGEGFVRYRRAKHGRASVRVAEVVSRAFITLGGMGTIVAVSGVLLFLLWVVKDLFSAAEFGDVRAIADVGRSRIIGCDEYRVVAWQLDQGGRLRVVAMHDGEVLAEHSLGEGAALTAVAPVPAAARPNSRQARTDLSLGFDDGTVHVVELVFTTEYFEADEVPAAVRSLGETDAVAWAGGVVQRTPSRQFRRQTLAVAARPALQVSGPVRALHRGQGPDGPLLAVLWQRGQEAVAGVAVGEMQIDFGTGEEQLAWTEPAEFALPDDLAPSTVLVTDAGGNALVLGGDGDSVRFSIRDPAAPAVAERVDLLPDDGVVVSATGLLLGDSTLLVGGDDGSVRGWFLRNDAANEVDGTALIEGHRMQLEGGAVRCFATSERERIFLAGVDDGAVHALFMTSERWMAAARVPGGTRPDAVAMAPKNDGILAAHDNAVSYWHFDPKHPEITAQTLLGRVHYERYPEPDYVWQSSSGNDDFEKKFSLVPLIFGTAKATVYSMAFGAPLALLAAIYTCEFLSRRARARIKPIIEMMASLPSVVLGFLAALVIAPFVEQVVPSVLCSFFTVPFALLLGANLWRLLSRDSALRLDAWRLPLMGLTLLGGLLVAALLGPAIERLLFAGDVRAWLGGNAGSGRSGWFVTLLPGAALVVTFWVVRWVHPRLHSWSGSTGEGARHLLAFVLASGVTLGLAWLLAVLIYDGPSFIGWGRPDLRHGLSIGGFDLSPIATYDQRNAMIVGFVMGFAVIPIIYTIAEDALASVPEHLRAASLGAGATQWQTATRIVIPTAMSGLFSAVMIGLGRAVGETMIVLMAAGNTPVLSMNAFSGFRTLSANIATELPEAARDSTHYRTLFLAALVLFAMTFFINTLAEAVRLRFRKRAFEL